MALRRLPIAGTVSLLAAAVLASGYVGEGEVAADRWPPGGARTAYRGVQLKADEGRVVCHWTTGTASRAAPVRAPSSPPGMHFDGRVAWRPRFDAKRALWDADAHVLTRTATSVSYIYAAPIWCFELLCSIAPAAWWRRWRARRRACLMSAAFPVA